MKLLWLGSFASDEMFAKMLARTIGQASSHAAQSSIIAGLDNQAISMDTINAHNYPPYPVFPIKRVPFESWSRNGISKDINIGFLNMKYINHISKAWSLRKAVVAWTKKQKKGQNLDILVYSMHSPLLYAAMAAKKKYKNVRVHLIVPDLPEFVDMGANRLKKWLKKADFLVTRYLLREVDSFILFSEHMASYLSLSPSQWLLMEGSINISEIVDNACECTGQDENKIIIMYAGVIDKYRGIIELLDAFCEIPNENYELWFTGSGAADAIVYARAEKDFRIKHFGYLAKRSEVLALEQKANILLNLRMPEEKVAKYCFPSKIFEYMASGKPVISVRTPGIPEEYFNYIVGIDKLTKAEIIKSISYLANMCSNERFRMGQKARDFVFREKNQDVQAKRILEFIQTERAVDCKMK